MMRSFLVPVVSSLGLSMTAACKESLVGPWDLAVYTVPAGPIEMPHTSTATWGDHTYTYYENAYMWIRLDFTGTFTDVSSVSVDRSAPVFYKYRYAVVATQTAEVGYDIRIDTADVPLRLGCTMGGRQLQCDGQNNPNVQMLFKKRF